MADKKDIHCYECAGKGKERGYECNTCDGEGNLKKKSSKKGSK